jgi:hypothetical protein
MSSDARLLSLNSDEPSSRNHGFWIFGEDSIPEDLILEVNYLEMVELRTRHLAQGGLFPQFNFRSSISAVQFT